MSLHIGPGLDLPDTAVVPLVPPGPEVRAMTDNDDMVLHWYECGRKVAHPSQRGAEIAALDVWRHRDNSANPPGVYRCGDHYHVGRASNARTRLQRLRAARKAFAKYGPAVASREPA